MKRRAGRNRVRYLNGGPPLGCVECQMAHDKIATKIANGISQDNNMSPPMQSKIPPFYEIGNLEDALI